MTGRRTEAGIAGSPLAEAAVAPREDGSPHQQPDAQQVQHQAQEDAGARVEEFRDAVFLPGSDRCIV